MDLQQQNIDSTISNYGMACEASKASFNKNIDRMKGLFDNKTKETMAQIRDISTKATLKHQQECEALTSKLTTTYKMLVSTNAIDIKNNKF